MNSGGKCDCIEPVTRLRTETGTGPSAKQAFTICIEPRLEVMMITVLRKSCEDNKDSEKSIQDVWQTQTRHHSFPLAICESTVVQNLQEDHDEFASSFLDFID